MFRWMQEEEGEEAAVVVPVVRQWKLLAVEVEEEGEAATRAHGSPEGVVVGEEEGVD